MLLKVTTEYFAGHKTTPNEPNPCASPFCLCLLGCLVSYRPLASWPTLGKSCNYTTVKSCCGLGFVANLEALLSVGVVPPAAALCKGAWLRLVKPGQHRCSHAMAAMQPSASPEEALVDKVLGAEQPTGRLYRGLITALRDDAQTAEGLCAAAEFATRTSARRRRGRPRS